MECLHIYSITWSELLTNAEWQLNHIGTSQLKYYLCISLFMDHLKFLVHCLRKTYALYSPKKAEEHVFRKESSSETGSRLCKYKSEYFSKYKIHF